MKALERQLAAQKIELDTRDAWAHFDVHQPIDLSKINKAATDASYTLKTLDFTVTGQVEASGDKKELVIAPHGQRLPWSGEGPKTKSTVRIRLSNLKDVKPVLYRLAPSSEQSGAVAQ